MSSFDFFSVSVLINYALAGSQACLQLLNLRCVFCILPVACISKSAVNLFKVQKLFHLLVEFFVFLIRSLFMT